MNRLSTTLLGVTEPHSDGNREWRFCVNGSSRAYFTVKAKDRQSADAALEAQVRASTANRQLGETSPGTALTLGALGLAGYFAFKVGSWWVNRHTPER